MLYTAQHSMRMQTTAKPFKTRLSRHTDEPPLTVGIMTDTSGSMTLLMGFATALSWAMSRALKGIGKSVSVAYNTQVTVLSAPGEAPSKPFPLEAGGAGEDFKTAFSIVDGSLNLTTGKGVRLLFVISDGEYTPTHIKAAQDAIQRLERGGARVIWFSPMRNGAVALKTILGRRIDHMLVPVAVSQAEALAGKRGGPKADTEAMTETVIAEITSALRKSFAAQ